MPVVHGSRRRHGRTGVGRGGLVGCLAFALTIAGAAVAAEVPRTGLEVDPARRPTLRLHHERLLPRVSAEMETLSSFHRLATPGIRARDHVLFDEMSASVRRGAKRMTRKAVKAYLLEAVHLDRGIQQIRRGIRSESSPSRRVDFRVGFHSLLPQLGLRYRRGQHSLGLTVGADGGVGVRFRNDRFERAELSAGFDGHDTFRVHARLGF